MEKCNPLILLWLPCATDDRPETWLKPLTEKPAEAGSAWHVVRISGPEGPVYYASRQPAEAGSGIGLPAAKPSVQAMNSGVGRGFSPEFGQHSWVLEK